MNLKDAVEVSECGGGFFTIWLADGTSVVKAGSDVDATTFALSVGLVRSETGFREGKRQGQYGAVDQRDFETMEEYPIAEHHNHFALAKPFTADDAA